MFGRIGTSISLATLSVVAGCATSSGVLPMGPDTYSVSADSGFEGYSAAKRLALVEAQDYCSSLGRELLVINTQSSHIPGG